MSDSSSKIQSLLKTRAQLCQNILEIKTLILEEELKIQDGSCEDTLEELKMSVQKASDDLSSINGERSIQELALNRLKLGQTAIACLCTDEDAPDTCDTKYPHHKQVLLDLLKDQRHLGTLVMKLNQDVETLEEHYWKLCTETRELQLSATKLEADFTNLKETKERPLRSKDDPTTQLECTIKEDMELAGVLQKVLLKLIQGSRVNWAADEKLLNLVLMLGTSFKFDD